MSDNIAQASPAKPLPLPPPRAVTFATALSRALHGITAVSLFVAILAEGPNTYINFSQWRQLRAVAENATTLQRAEAEGKRAEAQKELARARNAIARITAEADEAEADASRLAQVATSKQNEAANAKNKSKADADVAVNQAQLLHQQGLTELANAQVAATQMKIEADQAEQDLKATRYALRQTVYTAGLIHCPGTSYIAKITAAYEHDGQCSQ